MVVGTDSQKIIDNAMIALHEKWKSCAIPELWDGLASERIARLVGANNLCFKTARQTCLLCVNN